MSDTLADHLRTLPDEDLITLFRLRPDLVVPPPGHTDALAGRVRSRLSVARALDQLDRFHLEVLDAVRLARGPDELSSLERVLALTTATPGGPLAFQVRAAVGRLAELLLIYGPDDALRVVSTIDDVAGPYPAGLGRPAQELSRAAAELVADPAGLRRAIMSAPPEARRLLDRLATEGPVATVAGQAATGAADKAAPDAPAGTPAGPGADDRGGDVHEPARPVTAPRAVASWLAERGLLAATSPTTVELPREIGVLLRRDTGPLGPLHPTPPVPAGQTRDPARVDAAGAGAAMEAVRQADTVLTALADDPAPTLRGGGLGIRELRRLARVTGVPEPMVALLLETGYAAGLLGEDTRGGAGDDGPTLLPTGGYDSWRLAPLAERWHRLATAWLVMRRQPGLVGQRDARGRLVGPLTAGADRARAPELRRTTLAALAALAPGTAVGLEELLTLLRWHAPGRVAGQRQAMGQVLTEAEWLGVTGQGALTSYGHALVTGGDERAGEAPAVAMLSRLLPEPVAELVVQADLSVVVPGPPEPELAAELELVTEQESAGGASVHRVTRDSVRRALDAGYTAADLHAMFSRRSRTPVPQALTYLIDDVARTHGGLRVGAAAGYLRSEDESLVAQVLVDRRLAGLELRRLAPTVLVSPHPAARMLAALREAGYAPVPEDAYGAVVLAPPRGRRAPVRARPASPAPRFAAATASEPRLRRIVEDMRRGDAAARIHRRVRPAGSGPAAAQAHAEALAVLRQALKDRAPVWVGYLDAHGSTTSRLLRPVSIGAGYLRAESVGADTLHTVALHRITGATRET